MTNDFVHYKQNKEYTISTGKQEDREGNRWVTWGQLNWSFRHVLP